MHGVRRREFLIGAAALLAVPLGAEAQQAKKFFRIGYLSAPTRESVEGILDAFLRALRELGWIEGQNIVIDYRWAEGDLERLPGLARDLVLRNVDVIVAPAASAALAAKHATSTIPIVMIFPNDPIGQGLVSNLRRPEGNVTGTTNIPISDMLGKRLQILKEAVPKATRVALVYDPTDQVFSPSMKGFEAAARSLSIQLQYLFNLGRNVFHLHHHLMKFLFSDGPFALCNNECHHIKHGKLRCKCLRTCYTNLRSCMCVGASMCSTRNR